MSKHTPGSWRIFVGGNDGWPGVEAERFSIVIRGDRTQPDDDSGVRGATHEEAVANARLIAAAPNLLDALKAIAETDWVDACLDPQRAIRIARAAISKPKGEPT